jgi:hypothetical protein
MQTFLKLFGSWIQFFYHGFDRVVLNGYLFFFHREANVAWFFRQVLDTPPTKAALRARSTEYVRRVETYVREQGLKPEWAPKGVRKEEWVAARLQSARRRQRFGLYAVLMSMEQGQSFRCVPSRRQPDNAHWIHLEAQWSRYRHYYFYLYDPVLGACCLRIGTFLPFVMTAWINGHEFIARRLQGQKVAFTQCDNAIVACADAKALQTAADALTARVIRTRLQVWTHLLGPKFSAREHRQVGSLRRQWFVQQVEYCLNWVFGARRRLRQLFERSCELSLLRLSADQLSQLFGAHRRRRIQGKWQLVLERFQHAQHAFRAYWRHSFLKQYEKWCRFLRMEVTSNALKDFGLGKSLDNWEALRGRLREVVNRFAATQARTFNVHGEFDLLARLARSVAVGKTKVGGIKLEQKRLMRLLEVLLQVAGQACGGWTATQLHQALLARFELAPAAYKLGALRYDIRKLKAHGLIQRVRQSYRWRLTVKGQKVAVLLLLLRKRVYGPLADSSFGARPDRTQHTPDCRWERAYHKVDTAMDELIECLAA